MEDFLKGSSHLQLQAQGKQEVYDWIAKQINRIKYFKLGKKEKGITINYLAKISGYSKVQVKKLLGRKRHKGQLKLTVSSDWGKRNIFTKVYTEADIETLAETDNLHRRPTGQALQNIFKRMFNLFKDEKFVRLQNISLGHIYNLRVTERYVGKALTYTKTNPVKVPIGIRRKPQPYGKPGFLRVDSVHQGDLDKQKGVYHINLVDEVTQWEIVVCVEGISEYFLIPALEKALTEFPFKILNFHSDNGSEYINYQVADLLERLIVKQTKSRSRHSNDNGLVETKNKIIRKWNGYNYIPKKFAPAINQWYESHFNTYLNFHRQCAYPTTYTDAKGKQKKKYETYLTPYEKLKTLENWTQYLAPGWTQKELDDISLMLSDNEFAKQMNEAKRQIWKTINHH
jgi:transposase InsO family protein